MAANPPFRADMVGSLLRTAPLKQARERRARGEIDAAALRAVEDAEIAVQTDAAIGCMVIDWGRKGLEGRTAALINLMRRRGLDRGEVR